MSVLSRRDLPFAQLLEQERHVGARTLIAQWASPFGLHWPFSPGNLPCRSHRFVRRLLAESTSSMKVPQRDRWSLQRLLSGGFC